MIVVLEFSQRKEVMPVVLLFVDKDSEVLIQLLVDLLGLSVRLWMPGSG